jgi:hypothetical protein
MVKVLKKIINNLTDARLCVVALLVKCPCESNPIKCYFHDLRKNSLVEKIEFCKRLSEAEVLYMIAEHKKCLSQKKGKKSLQDEWSLINELKETN